MGRERLTARRHDIVLLRKDGQLRTPMELSGQETRMVLERLAELEDKLESGKLVPVVRCKDCENYSGKYCTLTDDSEDRREPDDFCSYGERKEQKICLTEDCPYQKGSPCEAAEGCGGYEGAEDSFLMNRFMRLE